jgi:hypothetical protein
LESRLRKRYKTLTINNKNCFLTEDGTIIHLTGLKSFNAIVIEYASSEDEAKKNMFEDGDLFYLKELDEEQMFQAMIQEIEE